jgi:DNA mismatch repair protein MutL
MPIRILPNEIASQIAAGEVIERPASVVKELIENALDAGASHVEILILGSGKQLIEVSDDGQGIPADELELAVERHATSKLKSADELFQIATLGFRGEALASIGSVSRMSITSHSPDSTIAASLLVEGGIVYKIQPIGAPQGTMVSVENLFFNVPARLKFLKTDMTERRIISQLVTKYALAYPKIRFHLRVEGSDVLRTSGSGLRREVLGALYGPDNAKQMIEVLYRDSSVAIEGFISPISITRSHRREILIYVNGRPVQDAALISAITKGYHTLLMVGRYPIAAIFLDVPPENVDVNVHPTKSEVRFREPEKIFTGVQSAVRRALLAHNPVPGLSEKMMWTSQIGFGTDSSPAGSIWSTHLPPPRTPSHDQVSWGSQSDASIDGSISSISDPSIQPTLSGSRVPILRPIGQIVNAYLVAEGPDGLYLIDQHAAHERVLFEKIVAQMNDMIPSQGLLQPAAVELSIVQSQSIDQMLPILNKIGFEIESFGLHTYLIRRLPTLLLSGDPADLLRSLVENFEEDETPLQNQIEKRLIARICKRAAVKAGMELSGAEQKALLLDLENCESPRTCPHGRPTMIHLSVDLLEKQFGRRGPP